MRALLAGMLLAGLMAACGFVPECHEELQTGPNGVVCVAGKPSVDGGAQEEQDGGP